MMTKMKNFSPDFRLEAAQLLVDQSYTVKAACDAMGIGKSNMEYRVHRIRSERPGKPTQKGEVLTLEQREVQKLEGGVGTGNWIFMLRIGEAIDHRLYDRLLE